MPVGVVPSPSTWWSENPFSPITAGHGPPAGSQQAPDRCHSSSVAAVVTHPAATTVTSWRAGPVRASCEATPAGQPPAADTFSAGPIVVGGTAAVAGAAGGAGRAAPHPARIATAATAASASLPFIDAW